nr:MAG TPA: hypothetical protein [Bacteriophage sp.]
MPKCQCISAANKKNAIFNLTICQLKVYNLIRTI